MAAASTHVFSSTEHAHLVPYLAALHGSCITQDRMIGTFRPPLHHEKLLAWWKERIAEVNAGTRVILILLNGVQPGARPVGTQLVGVAMLDMPQTADALCRAYVEKVLVSNKFRGHGGARALMNAIEAEALEKKRKLLTLDVESETAAEGVFRRMGYVEVGKIPKYSRNQDGNPRGRTFFYKDLEPVGS